MRIRQLGSIVGNTEICQHLTSFVINGSVAIDAGCLGLMSPVTNQRQVKHVLLSHSHIDHLATLPLFLDNVFQPGPDCPIVHASQDVWECLTNDVFNERLWPDLSRISSEDYCFFDKAELVSEVPIQIQGLTITPVAVDHAVPTLGFLIEDDDSSAIIASDTGPTERLWELARRPAFRDKLRVLFLECSYPNDYEWLAQKSKHLCTRLFAAEIAKLSPGNPFLTVAVHLKAPLQEQIRKELESLALPDFVIGGQDQEWDF